MKFPLMKTVYIETERLILRSWEADDIARFAEMNRNDEVMKYFPAPLTAAQSESFAHNIMAELEEFGYGLYAACLHTTGDFIGYVGFHHFSFDAPFAPGIEIGWRLSYDFWHKGYATEAAKACIEYAIARKMCDRLFSFTAVPNTPSENVMKRIGMTYSGTFMHPALPDGHWLKEHKLYIFDL